MRILTNKPSQLTKDRTGKFEVIYLDSRNSKELRYAIKKYVVSSDKNFLIVASSEDDMNSFRLIVDLVIE